MGYLRMGVMKKKKILVYKILLLLSYPIAVVLRSVFGLILMLMHVVSGGNISVSAADGNVGLAVVGFSFIGFCLVSVYQIIKEEKEENSENR